MSVSLFVHNQKTEIADYSNSNLLCGEKLQTSCYEHAFVVPPDLTKIDYHRGVILENGQIVPNTTIYETFNNSWGSEVNLADFVDEDCAIYLGWLEPVWGHALTDSLKKMWFLRTEECKELLKNGAKLICVRPWESRSVNDLFGLLGIDLTSIQTVSQLTKYKKLYIPDNSIIVGDNDIRYYTKEYKNLITEIYSKIPITESTGKIYFTRSSFTKSQSWREYGENSIEKVFSKLGYRIISPENLSVIDSLTLVKNCDAFASTEGSISHNAVFCKPHTQVTILRKVDFINTWQLLINQVANLDVTYVDTHQSIISKGCMGPYYICVTKELQEYVGHYIPHIPHWLNPHFWWYLVKNRRIVKWVIGIFVKQ